MPRNNFLHSSCFNIPGAPEQLPGFIWFYIWFHRGLLKSPPPVPLHSFPHSCGFNISASPRLSTASCMHRIWVQYLDFRFSSQQLLAFILVSMSNFPLSHLPLSHQFSAVTWLQYLHVPPFLSTPSCMHLVSISKFPPPLFRHSFSGPKNSPCVSQHFLHVSSCIFISFQCLGLGFTPHLSTTFCAHPVSISNFPFLLCARQFPASISLHT